MISPRSIALAVLLCAGSGCGDETAPLVDGGVLPDPWTGAGVSCDGTDLQVVRVLPWLGGGVQLVVDSDADSLALAADGGGPVESAVAPIEGGAGVTAILLCPAADPATHDARRAAVAALIDGLPAAERIALLEAPPAGAEGDAGAPAALVADLGRDRAHLRARLDAIGPAAGRTAVPAIPGLEVALAAVEGSFGAVHRDLVVVGEPPREIETAGFRPVARSWLDENGGELDPVRGYAGWAGDRTARVAAGEILGLWAGRRAARRRVGGCPPAGAAPLLLQAGATTCTVTRPPAMDHLAGESCVAVDAAGDRFPYAAEIELSFTADERVVYDQRYAESSKEDFATHVRLGGGVPIAARAHFRGQTSLGCARKSLFVELAGAAPRRLLAGAASDRFLLISMCKDSGYFGQGFGDRLMAGRELFPLRFGFVVLRLDGVNQGVYLLLEHPDRSMVRDLLAGAAVIRRRFDPDGIPVEVEFPVDPEPAEAARQRYLAAVAEAEDGPVAGLDQRLAALLDLDGYLRWLALASLLENGDYVDEVFFYGSMEPDALWLRIAGWDPDDLFEVCHHDGIWALEDPCDLLFCAEGDLDRALLRSPAVYRRFGAILSGLLDELSAEPLAATMAAVRTELFAALEDDETAAAMVELIASNPAAATAAGARADISARMDGMLAAAEARGAVLRARLDSCPELAQ